MSENKLSFIDLQRFLVDRMDMHTDYQPIMIKTLLNAPQKAATKDEIADKIKQLNPGLEDKDFKSIPVYEVLEGRGIVKKEGEKFILNAEELTNDQSRQLSVLCDWRIEYLPLQDQIQDLIRTYHENRNLFNPDKLSVQEREKLRSEFVSDYSKDKIPNLRLDEYVTGKRDPNSGGVNKSTFCYRLENVMDKLSGFGIRSSYDFGVYCKKGDQKYAYRGDYASAEAKFDEVKAELVSIIEAGDQYHIDHDIERLSATLEKYHSLPRRVQLKILSLYFPDDFVEVYTLEKIQIILEFFGKQATNIQHNLFLAQAQLLEVKNNDPLMKQWSIADFSHFVWQAIIQRSTRGKQKEKEDTSRLYLTAYNRENLETSKKHGILGWKQRPGTLALGDYVFVYNISSQQIESCFKVKMMSDDRNLLWQDEIDSGKLKYSNRWNAEIEKDFLNLSLDEIYTYEPFKTDKSLFSLLTRNQSPRSLEGANYADFHAFLSSKISNNYLVLMQQPTSNWKDEEGKEYEYAESVTNYRRIVPGTHVIFRRTKDENGKRLKGGMKFFGHGKISSISDTGEKGKTQDGKDYNKKIARISNYTKLDLDEPKRKEVESKLKELANFNRQNAIIQLPKDLYEFIIGTETESGVEVSVQSNELYERIRQESIKRNLNFEPLQGNPAAHGFEISDNKKQYKICGNILNSAMGSEVWQGITDRLYNFYDSNNADNLVIISDTVQNHFLALPFKLLKPAIYQQMSGTNINRNFKIRRDPYQLSENKVLLSPYVDNMDIIFALPNLIEKTHLNVTDIQDIQQRLLEKGQFIFYGPPGTGKTYVAEAFADYFTTNHQNVEVVQFHPSYGYEDFIEGIRPNKIGGFETKAGIFKRFAKRCSDSPDEKFVLIIDEINRGDIAKIFGELIHLLLQRGKKITLTYSSGDDDKFAIPPNLYIIATMNSQDRSVAFLDYANRRRFSMRRFNPDMEILRSWLHINSNFSNKEDFIDSLEKINQIITQRMDEDFQIGHSYFMESNMNYEKVKRIIEYELKPLVEQYFFAKRDAAVLKEIYAHFENILEFSKMDNTGTAI